MTDTPNTFTITRPDDWHVHLRDGDALALTVPHTARYFGRAIVMPNLVPPVTTVEKAEAYKQRIQSHIPDGSSFQPLMTLYLTDSTTPAEIQKASDSDSVFAAKLYPAGATTNSDSGVTDLDNIIRSLEKMSDTGLPLLVHGEVTDKEIDIFDREKIFIEKVLSPLKLNFPKLKLVLEHITTQDAVEFVNNSDDTVAATITPQHLLFNRNDMLVGGIKPHYYCLPILKRNIHQQALLEAATSGSHKFFLGTDSAPHAKNTKENACGCAGCFTSYGAIELYAKAFESMDSLDKLEAFSSFNGPDFYGLPRNSDSITLKRKEWTIPDVYSIEGLSIAPLCHGETLAWSVDE